ncbi:MULTISPECIES: conjugal transfer protein TrbN [Pandoraea]|uniref:conjugal transfer protein TrbN n=1 Tax=Pandoraea TaxID=93217 RepID=UPI001240146A|nr:MULTISPECIES: conjugal transfer protein TrbN [Pandoraea]
MDITSERFQCSVSASIEFAIPVNAMLAVAEQEGGRPGIWMKNSNGTFDVGAMQLNTSYLRQLAGYGIRAADVAAPGCYAYRLAAWRIRQHIVHDSGDFWTRVANYHSRTPIYNADYRQKIMVRGMKWANWLARNFPVYYAQ